MNDRAAPSPTTQPGDGALAAAASRGDRAAAEQLVNRHLPAVRRFLLRLTDRHADADDLTQETMLRMLRHAHHYDPARPMTTWLFAIAYRLWLNHAAKAARRKAAPLISEPGTRDVDASAARDQQTHARRLIEDALQQLTPAQRDAVVLFHQQQLPLDDAAAVMGVPVNTLKSHLHRARARLRELLEPHREALTP